MYLSKNRILLSNLLSAAMIMVSSFFIFIGFVGVGLVISWFTGSDEYFRRNESVGEYLAVYIGLLLVFGVLMTAGIRRLILAGKARKFNSLFENDPDGVISLEKAAGLFGMPVHKFVSLFDRLVKKGFLVNCSLSNPDNPVIVLNNGAATAEERFDVIHCPNCGAPNQIKLGFVEICRYCGSGINKADG